MKLPTAWTTEESEFEFQKDFLFSTSPDRHLSPPSLISNGFKTAGA
jgi:hypothetical protein